LPTPPAAAHGLPHDADDEAWTFGICIRCAQLFPPVLSSCPHCRDLAVTVRERAGDPLPWAFKVSTSGAVVMRLEGFASATDAQAHGHEFVRRYVAQRRL
jgi:hypothetical protein